MKRLQYFFDSLYFKLTLLLLVTVVVSLSCIQLSIALISHQHSSLLLIFFFPFFAIFVAICIFTFYYHVRRFLQHIRQLTMATQHWSQGDFLVTIQNTRNDEIGQLTEHLNIMAQKLQDTIEVQRELASANERNHLARELHDTVKQMVFALEFQIAIARKLHQPEQDQLAMHLEEAQRIVQDIQKEMTNLIFPMRQAALNNQDLADSLATYLSKWSYQYSIFVRFTSEIQGQEKNYAIPSHVKKTFFRITQEALSNVARHSKASDVQVTLTIGWLYVTLQITDNGTGFDYSQRKGSGVGLSSMEERMQAIGGQLQFESLQPSGTKVLATYKSQEAGPDIAMIPTFIQGK